MQDILQTWTDIRQHLREPHAPSGIRAGCFRYVKWHGMFLQHFKDMQTSESIITSLKECTWMFRITKINLTNSPAAPTFTLPQKSLGWHPPFLYIMKFQIKVGRSKACYNPYSPHLHFQSLGNLVANLIHSKWSWIWCSCENLSPNLTSFLLCLHASGITYLVTLWVWCQCQKLTSHTRELKICLKTSLHCQIFTELCIPAQNEAVKIHWRIGHFTVNLGQSAIQTGNKL